VYSYWRSHVGKVVDIIASVATWGVAET
jgi:hypothetical protein